MWRSEGEVAVIYTDPNDFSSVRDNLEGRGLHIPFRRARDGAHHHHRDIRS